MLTEKKDEPILLTPSLSIAENSHSNSREESFVFYKVYFAAPSR